MAEKESYERTVERLCGEIDALRSILLAVAEELPERATYHIEEHARQLRQDADNDAKAKVEQVMQEKTKALTAGMPLPPGMKLPF